VVDPAKRRRFGLLAGVIALAAVIPVCAYAGHVLRFVEVTSVDERFSIRGSRPPEDVVVVGIDDATFNAFNNYRLMHPGFQAQWPFPRCDHARVLDHIAAGHPKVIAFDVQFSEQTTPQCDDALLRAVGKARPVILGTTEVDKSGRPNVLGGYPLVTIGAAAANGLLIPDYGGIIRRVPYQVNGLTTFGVAAAAVADGKPVPRPQDGMRWINFAGEPGTVKAYSYSDVYFGKVPPSAFRDKAVVIGPSAPTLGDVHPTSVSGDPAKEMSGAEIQANITETALHGFSLRTTPLWLNVLLIVALAAAPAVAVIRVRPLQVLLLAIPAGVLYAVATQLAFNHDRILLLVYPLIALVLSTFGSMIVSYETASIASPT
jgi:adenylate cyclase